MPLRNAKFQSGLWCVKHNELAMVFVIDCKAKAQLIKSTDSKFTTGIKDSIEYTPKYIKIIMC